LVVDRTHCHFEGMAVDAAMYAAHALYTQGQKKLGAQYEGFAREAWRVLHAETRGFRERFGES